MPRLRRWPRSRRRSRCLGECSLARLTLAQLGGFADLLVRFIGDSIESVRIAVIRSAGQLSRHHDIAAVRD